MTSKRQHIAKRCFFSSIREFETVFEELAGESLVMGVIHVTDMEGNRHTLECIEGWRVMEIIRDWGLPMEGICGGACECGTCHVYIDEKWLPKLYPALEEEELQLDTLPLVMPNSRLSCQILWTPELDGLELTLGPTG